MTAPESPFTRRPSWLLCLLLAAFSVIAIPLGLLVG
jgi:hypothetical protein